DPRPTGLPQLDPRLFDRPRPVGVRDGRGANAGDPRRAERRGPWAAVVAVRHPERRTMTTTAETVPPHPTPAPAPPAPPAPPPPAARPWSKVFRGLILAAIFLALAAAGGPFAYEWVQYRRWHSITDDAFVEAHIVNVAP